MSDAVVEGWDCVIISGATIRTFILDIHITKGRKKERKREIYNDDGKGLLTPIGGSFYQGMSLDIRNNCGNTKISKFNVSFPGNK